MLLQIHGTKYMMEQRSCRPYSVVDAVFARDLLRQVPQKYFHLPIHRSRMYSFLSTERLYLYRFTPKDVCCEKFGVIENGHVVNDDQPLATYEGVEKREEIWMRKTTIIPQIETHLSKLVEELERGLKPCSVGYTESVCLCLSTGEDFFERYSV